VSDRVLEIQLGPNLATSYAEHQIGRAQTGKRAMISDMCVLREALKIAARDGLTLNFYTYDKKARIGLDLIKVEAKVLEFFGGNGSGG
jgi:hypothetical protein